MWDEQKRQRFQELRQPDRQLDAAEQAELAALVKEIEDREAMYLKPANERLRRENDRTEKQNAELDKLIKRKEALAQRLNHLLAETQAERRAIENEIATVLAGRDTDACGTPRIAEK